MVTTKRRAYAPRVPAAQRRAELLDATLRLIVTQGHTATTMDAVAAQAGVTKPVVYSVFPSRAELLAALLRREQEQALRQLLAILPGAADPQADPAGFLTRALTEFLAMVEGDHDRWYCIVMPMADMPAEFHAARERAREVTLSRAEAVATGFGALDPEITAHTAVTLCEMAARLTLAHPGRFHPDRFAARLCAAVGVSR